LPTCSRTRPAPVLIFALTAIAAALFALGCAKAPEEEAPPADLTISRSSDVASPALTDGWIGFIEGLEEGRRAIEDPAFFPPEPSDRNLGEGYRYLLGHLARIIEAQTQQHPDFPYFQRSVRMLSKWTLENPDTMYLSAAIDADGVYRIRGRALDATEWRTSERGRRGPRAPGAVIFQPTTASVGQTGELAEMANCRNQTIDALDHFELEVDDEGRFEIIVAARRPRGYEGPFLASRGEAPCPSAFGTTTYRMREATQLNVREIFSDWDSQFAARP